MNQETRYRDNGNGTVTDIANEITWTQEDSWQMETKWVTWDEADEHIRHLSDIKFAGYNDWRFPSKAEAVTLYGADLENKDKYGNRLYLDPVFPEGALPTIWIHEYMTGEEGYILDLRNGEVRRLFKSKSGRMAARALRSDREAPKSRSPLLPF
ncbi:MAG: DUF1566 domain-containing protein [Nitrospinaceae bacterium]|nr:DUF1566 domain-containing protein [Nitrospinaceae bacterium]